jgi:hypothetical protein
MTALFMREAIGQGWGQQWLPTKFLPAVVTITRVGPRKCDDDGIVGGCKAVRDEIASLLRIDDGDPRIAWLYAQRKGRYSVEVDLAPRARVEQRLVEVTR